MIPIQFSLANSFYLFLKISLILFAFLYFIFSLIVYRQVVDMTRLVKTPAGGVMRILSLLFILMSIAITISFVVFL